MRALLVQGTVYSMRLKYAASGICGESSQPLEINRVLVASVLLSVNFVRLNHLMYAGFWKLNNETKRKKKKVRKKQ